MTRRAVALITLITPLLAGGCSFGPRYTADGSPRHSDVHRQAVGVARELVGVPYRFGGESPKGVDCSGLVYYAYRQAGSDVPRTTRQQYRAAVPIDPASLRAGDLLFFQISGRISHVGMYLKDDRFVHAPSSGKSVTFGRLGNPYWRDHFIAAGRINPR